MHVNEYIAEKLRELENQRQDPLLYLRMAQAVDGHRPSGSKPVIGPVMRVAGRTLRRAGEGLEGWGATELERDRRLRAERRTG